MNRSRQRSIWPTTATVAFTRPGRLPFLLTRHHRTVMDGGVVCFHDRAAAQAMLSHGDEVVTDWNGFRTAHGEPNRVLEVTVTAGGMLPDVVAVEKGDLVLWKLRGQGLEEDLTVSVTGYPEVASVTLPASGEEVSLHGCWRCVPGAGFPRGSRRERRAARHDEGLRRPHRGRGGDVTLSGARHRLAGVHPEPEEPVGWSPLRCCSPRLTLLIAYFGMVTAGYAGFPGLHSHLRQHRESGRLPDPSVRPAAGRLQLSLQPGVPGDPRDPAHPQVPRAAGQVSGVGADSAGRLAAGLRVAGCGDRPHYRGPGRAQLPARGGFTAACSRWVFTGLAVLIAILTRRRQIALGIALATWVFFVLLYGVLMLGTTLYLPSGVLKTVLLVGLLGNPVDTVRVLSLLQVGGPHLFGPAGATLVKLAGSSLLATLTGLAGLAVWVVVPVAVSMKVFGQAESLTAWPGVRLRRIDTDRPERRSVKIL